MDDTLDTLAVLRPLPEWVSVHLDRGYDSQTTREKLQQVAVKLDDVHHPTMKAYSLDLREKIVDAVLRRGMSKAQAARTFGVGATSVKRYVKLQEEGKPLSPGKAPGKKGKLGQSGMKLLEEDLHARPTVSYEQRADYLFTLLGERVSISTICRMIKRLGYTRKKDRWVRVRETNG